MYDFMEEMPDELTTASEYLDYFLHIKQDVSIELDSINWSIMNCKLRTEECKSKIILETDFKELYGKDNESIRKAHINKELAELNKQYEMYKFKKQRCENKLDVIQDIINANMTMVETGE